MSYEIEGIVGQLLVAANTENISFIDAPKTPISLCDFPKIKSKEKMSIIARYKKHGFVVIEIPASKLKIDEALLNIGHSLNLGAPFTPPLYLKGNYKANTPVSKIATSKDVARHPSFEKNSGISLHSDGTLQKIGYVKSTIMLCESPGFKGGSTILFNACAAFAELAMIDKPAAAALSSPSVLVRQANINGCNDTNVGPAFAIRDGEFVSAYSVTNTDTYVAPSTSDKNALARGLEFMKHASRLGSPYRMDFCLAARQGVILANDKISHGRTSYQDLNGFHRCLYRGLYLQKPSLFRTDGDPSVVRDV